MTIWQKSNSERSAEERGDDRGIYKSFEGNRNPFTLKLKYALTGIDPARHCRSDFVNMFGSSEPLRHD